MQSQTPKDQEKVQRKPRKTNNKKKPNIPKKKREVKFEVKKEFE